MVFIFAILQFRVFYILTAFYHHQWLRQRLVEAEHQCVVGDDFMQICAVRPFPVGVFQTKNKFVMTNRYTNRNCDRNFQIQRPCFFVRYPAGTGFPDMKKAIFVFDSVPYERLLHSGCKQFVDDAIVFAVFILISNCVATIL